LRWGTAGNRKCGGEIECRAEISLLAAAERTLATLVDADRALFRHYGIERIPALMVIRGDGRAASYVVGMSGERDLRADIARTMEWNRAWAA
jgi:hypothetical protein